MMKPVVFFLTVLLGTAALGASAQQTWDTDAPTSDTAGKTFTEMDGNRDGVLTQREVEQGDFHGDFRELDGDGDGQVNRNEYYQYHRDRVEQNR